MISVIDDEAVANPGTAEIKAIWGEVAKHLAGPPGAADNYRVIANWQA